MNVINSTDRCRRRYRGVCLLLFFVGLFLCGCCPSYVETDVRPPSQIDRPRAGVSGTFSIVAVDLAEKYAALEHDAKGRWRGGKPPFEHPRGEG